MTLKNQFKIRKMLMPVLGLALLAPCVLPNMAYAANNA